MVSGFLCVNSSRPSDLPSWALGRAPAKHGSHESAFSAHQQPWASHLTFHRHFLKKEKKRGGGSVPDRGTIWQWSCAQWGGRGGQAWSEGHQGPGQKQQCQRKGPNQGVVSSGENFQLGFVKSRGVLMPMAGFLTETQLSPGGGGRQSRL